MLETRDLKLFGTTITVSSTNEKEELMEFSVDKGGTRDLHSITCHSEESKKEEEEQQLADKETAHSGYSAASFRRDLLGKRLADQTEENQNPRTPSFEKETVTTKSSRTEDDQSETSESEEKTILKKPDEILPCPRCNNMNTKFCYYNNYNVNQPRHFCKNCQRYWTAGGTMRNVPVGAGRRKSKNSPLNYRHITISEAFQMAQSDALDGLNHPSLKPKGTILTFGPDPPICDSMASVLNLADRARNGLHRPEENRISVPCVGGKGHEDSIRPAVRVSSSGELNRVSLQERAIQNGHGFPPQMTCYPGPSLPYPWNSAMCSPHFPIPFYPATTYWNCPVPGTWGHPWMFPPSSSSSQQGASTSNPDSPTSGKRSRDGEMLRSHIPEKDGQGKESNSERGVWTPKTLRIDDPDEAARSSIWSTLGNKNNKADSFSGRSLFKAFLPKSDENNCTLETSLALQANPAALSRSFIFQESL